MGKLARFLFLATALLAIVIGALRATAIRWWQVPSDDPYLEASVAPTLRGGDWILLWRLTAPSLGDLVLCPEPGAPGRVVIGRIAGVEGQTVSVKGTSLFVDGRRAASHGRCRESRFSVLDPARDVPVDQICDREELGGRVHLRGTAPDTVRPADVEMALGDGQVFLLSDNRLFPYDSRDFGPVERSTCTERVFFRLIGPRGFGDVETRFTFIH